MSPKTMPSAAIVRLWCRAASACLVETIASIGRSCGITATSASRLFADHLHLLHDDLGLPSRGEIDQTAVQRDRAHALRSAVFHGGQDFLGTLHLVDRGRVDGVGERDLARADRPFAFSTHTRPAPALRVV